MSHLNQKTVKHKIEFNGIGLHSGLNTNLSILPGKPDTGIIFKRIDLSGDNIIYPNSG